MTTETPAPEEEAEDATPASPADSPFFFKLIGAMFLVTNDPFRSTFYSRAKCEEILQAK